MNTVRVLAIASLGIVLGVQPVAAQSLARYREYTLGSSLASIVKISGARTGDTKTLHERPAKIQELEWRAPYAGLKSLAADPVRNVLFSFYGDQLYKLVVTYERERMEGLTDADVVEAISATYGAMPMQERATDNPPLDMPADTKVIARWDDGTSVLSLVRGGYSREFQLVLISKQLSGDARTAVKEASRLDAKEAPQRDLDQRNKKLADDLVTREKARSVNKAAFRP